MECRSSVELHNASAFVDQAPLLWPAVRRVDTAVPVPAGTGTAGPAGGLGPTAGDSCGLAAVDGSDGVHGVGAVGWGAVAEESSVAGVPGQAPGGP